MAEFTPNQVSVLVMLADAARHAQGRGHGQAALITGRRLVCAGGAWRRAGPEFPCSRLVSDYAGGDGGC